MLAGTTALAAAGSALAAFSGTNGRIAFVRSTEAGGDSDIYTMGAGGESPVSLTGAAGTFDRDPAWSADGERIAFIREPASGNREIWVMNHDGTGQTQVSTNLTGPDNPSFFPDGQRLAFAQNAAGGEQVFVVGIDGNNPTQLTFPGGNGDSAFGAAVSPDGRKIAFTREGIWVMNSDGSDQVRLTANSADVSDGAAQWSPDGQRIVFRRTTGGAGGAPDSDLVVMNADGSGQTPLTSGPELDRDPDFAPDGTLVVFPRAVTGGSSNIFVTDPGGLNQGLTPLTQNAAPVEDSDPSWQPLNPPACRFTGRTVSRSGRVGFRVGCALENASGAFSGSASVRRRATGAAAARRFKLRAVRVEIPAATRSKVSLALPRPGRRAVRRVLATSGLIRVRIRARLTDDLGQVSTKSFIIRVGVLSTPAGS